MGENVTIKEYMELSGYKTADKDFDITNLDPDCIFIGDVYVVKYKPKYDIRAPFEEQTYLKLKIDEAKKLIRKNKSFSDEDSCFLYYTEMCDKVKKLTRNIKKFVRQRNRIFTKSCHKDRFF